METAAVFLEFRPATSDDVPSVADVYLRSRKELVGCAPLVHSDEAVRDWIRRLLIPAGGTTVAVADGTVVGLLAVSKGTDCSWIEQLYLLPDRTERGIGTRLLGLARGGLPPPIRLYTFQCNERARRFYERRGFTAIAFGDGSGNEEKCPDILYEWRPGRGGSIAASVGQKGHRMSNPTRSRAMSEPNDNAAYRFPVSIKGVLLRDSRVILLRNERDEWELPGGKLEVGEDPETCLRREMYEEVGLEVQTSRILDSWVYEITPAVRVLIVTYGCVELSRAAAQLSSEHKGLGWHALGRVESLTMPAGYKRSITRWAASLDP